LAKLVYISDINANPFVSVVYKNQTIQSQLVGIYNANNINAAITIGHYFEVSDALIKKAIENYNPTNNRSQLSQKGSNKLILDAYNANPSSMAVALQNFRQLPELNKIAFLGDMFELGTESFTEHSFIINSVTNDSEIQFYFIGLEFYKVKIDLPHFKFFASFENLKEALLQTKFENNYILIKGSRGMALERIVDVL
jgi:UDP-N-acetylmuramoyl-tripeptide--D-alanyl-D-alanine ligase